ncbi:zinc knuckle CX2CX4HX4C containing protein [Tanacetum coccineum]
MASNIKNFKCLIHFNETKRGSILSEDLTYSMLHEMVMQKFNLEANAEINFSFKLSSFDFAVDITDDAEVQFFVGCACNSKDEFAQLFVSERKNDQKNMFFNFFESTTLENEGPSNPEITSSHLNNSYNNTSFLNNGISFDLGQNDFHINDSLQLQNEPHFSNPESSFAFRSNEYNTDDVVNENPQKKFHKWQKFMSFEPDIPETPVYKAKPNISKQYTQQSEVEKGNIFDNKEALILAVRLKALNEGFQFLTDRSAPERCHLKCYHFNQCDWKLRARLWDNTELLRKVVETGLEDVLKNGPWMIRNSPIILKKWTINSRLCKEELTRIPVWVKIHDFPIQVFSKDGLSFIASQIESLTMGVPLIDEPGFTIETVSIEYEWKPPCYNLCKIFGHVLDHYAKKVLVPSIVVTPNVEKTHDGFQTVGKKKKKGKSKSTNGGQFGGHSVKQTVRFEPKATTSVPKKRVSNLVGTSKSPSMSKNKPPKVTVPSSKLDNIPMSNSYAALDEESDEDVENVYDKSANLLHSS